MFMGGCIIDLVWKNDSLYLIIAMFSYKWVTLYKKISSVLEEYNSTTFTILITVLLEGGLKVDLSSQYFHIKYDKD